MIGTWKSGLLLFVVALVAFNAPGITALSPPTQPVVIRTAAGDHVALQIQVDDRTARPVAAVGALVETEAFSSSADIGTPCVVSTISSGSSRRV